MGSTLYEAATGRRLWGGGSDPRWLLTAWRHRAGLLPLHLTVREREERYGRVRAGELLKAPAWAPVLQGIEPYGKLSEAVRQVVAAPEAVLEFAYDWRLPVEHNGRLLAMAAREALELWRAAPEHDALRRLRPDRRPAQLVFVAHSMGGLVTRAALAHRPDLAPDTRMVVTLGTPFDGTVKAARILNGHRAPSPGPCSAVNRMMRDLAAAMPGVYDLLPAYRCLDTGEDAVHLTDSDVAALGGDRELADRSRDSRRRLTALPLPGHRVVIGVAQPTDQTMRLTGGVVRTQRWGFHSHRDGTLIRDGHGRPERFDHTGDGTVHRGSASLDSDVPESHVAAQHMALPCNPTVLGRLQAMITGEDTRHGPALGTEEISIEVPDAVAPATPWRLRLTGTDSPAGIRCTVYEAGTGLVIGSPRLNWQEGELGTRVTLPAEGLYRVAIDTVGGSPVTQLVLALAPQNGSDGRSSGDGDSDDNRN